MASLLIDLLPAELFEKVWTALKPAKEDGQHLRCTCKRLRRLCSDFVRFAVIMESDVSSDYILATASAFPHVTSLRCMQDPESEYFPPASTYRATRAMRQLHSLTCTISVACDDAPGSHRMELPEGVQLNLTAVSHGPGLTAVLEAIASPSVHQLRITLPSEYVDDDAQDDEDCFSAAALPNLRALHLDLQNMGSQLFGRNVASLAGCCGQLRRLDLSLHTLCGDALGALLADVPSLQDLGIDYVQVDAEGLPRVAFAGRSVDLRVQPHRDVTWLLKLDPGVVRRLHMSRGCVDLETFEDALRLDSIIEGLRAPSIARIELHIKRGVPLAQVHQLPMMRLQANDVQLVFA